MSEDNVGEHHLGDLAQHQLAAARRDPRMDRGPDSPTADFFDAVSEVTRSRMSFRIGMSALAAGLVEGSEFTERQAAWERIELGRAELDGDLGWVNSNTLVALHGAVDDLVEDLGPSLHRLFARVAVRDRMHKVAAEHPELFVGATDEMRMKIAEVVAEAVLENRKYPRPRFNGTRRWELPLAEVGLALLAEQPMPADLERVLVEACVLRDVLTHRGGRVDERAGRDCPTLGFDVGQFVRLGTARTLELSAALIAYGTDVAHRSLARIGVGEGGVDLSRWRGSRPLF